MSDEQHTGPRSLTEFWERRYSEADQLWSGKVNRVLADLVPGLETGEQPTALDLGCGEGGDVVWLAQQGWRATGLDISSVAVDRARQAAERLGLAGRATFRAEDLAALDAGQCFDLVTASFLHSPFEFDREGVLRSAAQHVAPGGYLLLTSHAEAPPWHRNAQTDGEDAQPSGDEHPMPHFPSPQEELDSLALDPGRWQIVIAEVRDREVTGPDGEAATLKDGVVLVRRLP